VHVQVQSPPLGKNSQPCFVPLLPPPTLGAAALRMLPLASYTYTQAGRTQSTQAAAAVPACTAQQPAPAVCPACPRGIGPTTTTTRQVAYSSLLQRPAPVTARAAPCILPRHCHHHCRPCSCTQHTRCCFAAAARGMGFGPAQAGASSALGCLPTKVHSLLAVLDCQVKGYSLISC
jgi:hypothetical protein